MTLRRSQDTTLEVELLDQRASRGDATRQALMRAAERLFAEKGGTNVTIREIVDTETKKQIGADRDIETIHKV